MAVLKIPFDGEALWRFAQWSDEELRAHIITFQAWMWLGERRLSYATIERRMSTLRTLLKFLHHHDLRKNGGENFLHLVRFVPQDVLDSQGKEAAQHLEEAVTEVAQSSPGQASLFQEENAVEIEPRYLDRRAELLTPEIVKKLLKAPNRRTRRGVRDWCILRLILLGLTRIQICTLNVGDWDAQKATLRVFHLYRHHTLEERMTRLEIDIEDASNSSVPKPKTSELNATESETLKSDMDDFLMLRLDAELSKWLCKYLQRTGHDNEPEAPVFCTLNHAQLQKPVEQRRLTENGIYTIVKSYARKIGYPSLTSRQLSQAARRIDSK